MVACPGGVQVQGEVRSLAISSIRTDGRTQQRHTLDPSVVSRYAEMMGEGVVFPPVRVWWDSAEYWLSDGFHRLAAAIEAHRTHFDADIRPGSLSDAQWDSFSANSLHGLQLSAQERQEVIQRALQHPKAANLSNVELAKQLHVSEKTIRRRRKPLSSAHAEDSVRLVTRGGATYPMVTGGIGQTAPLRRRKARRELQSELANMKEQASPRVRRLLIVLGNWAFGSATMEECLQAIERVVAEDKAGIDFLEHQRLGVL